jgi:hypothetical protein
MFYNIAIRGKCYKTFTAVSYRFLSLARAFVFGKPFQPSLMSEGKVGAYLSEAPFRWSTLG